MLNIEVPGELVLTLTLAPPFFYETLVVLFLVLILLAPLITHLYNICDGFKSRSSRLSLSRKISLSTFKKRVVVMHHPSPPRVTSSSSLSVTVSPVRNTISSPLPVSSAEDVDTERQKGNNPEDPLSLKQSLSFVATDFQLPIFDTPSIKCEPFKQRLIEILLEKLCDGRQHLKDFLNSSEFENVARKKVVEYLYPLDCFLINEFPRVITVDKATETKESVLEIDQVPELSNFRGLKRPSTPKRFLNFHGKRVKSIGNSKSSKSIVSQSRVLPVKNDNLRQKNELEGGIPDEKKIRQLLLKPVTMKSGVKIDDLKSPALNSSGKYSRIPKRRISDDRVQRANRPQQTMSQLMNHENKMNSTTGSLDSTNIDLTVRRKNRNDCSASSSEFESELSKFDDCDSRILRAAFVRARSREDSSTRSSRQFSDQRPRTSDGRLYWEKPVVFNRDWYSNPSSTSGSRCTTPRLKNTVEERSNHENELGNDNKESEIELKNCNLFNSTFNMKSSNLTFKCSESERLNVSDLNSKIKRRLSTDLTSGQFANFNNLSVKSVKRKTNGEPIEVSRFRSSESYPLKSHDKLKNSRASKFQQPKVNLITGNVNSLPGLKSEQLKSIRESKGRISKFVNFSEPKSVTMNSRVISRRRTLGGASEVINNKQSNQNEYNSQHLQRQQYLRRQQISQEQQQFQRQQPYHWVVKNNLRANGYSKGRVETKILSRRLL